MKLNLLLIVFIINISNAFPQSNKVVMSHSNAELLRQEGHTQRKLENFTLALDKYEASLEMYSALMDSLGMAKCLNNIGFTNALLGNNIEVIRSLYRAVEINKAIISNSGIINNYINLGLHYLKQKNFVLGLKYYRLGLEVLDNYEDTRKEVLILNGLGAVFGNEQNPNFNFDSAYYYYNKALKISNSEKENNQVANVFNNIGILFKIQNNYDSSNYYYHKSLALRKSNGDKKKQIVLRLNIGNLYLAQGNYGYALDQYLVGAEIALDLNDKKNYLHLLTNIIKCRIKLGQLSEDDSLFTIYYTLYDSINDQEKALKLKELEVFYETNKTESELESQIIQTQEKTKLSNRLLVGIIGALLLSVLIVLIFVQRQRFLKKIANKDLDMHKLNAMMQGQEEERNRIAEDLHDRLGARLSVIKQLAFDQSNGDNKLTALLDASINEAREISHNLSTGMLIQFGLEHVINDFIATINETNKITGEFSTTNLDSRFSDFLEKTLYYIILELVNNTLKHAEASSFFIQIGKYQNDIELIYEDDGKGFDFDSSLFIKGMGLRNLQARVESINGTLKIDTSPGNGVHISVNLAFDNLK